MDFRGVNQKQIFNRLNRLNRYTQIIKLLKHQNTPSSPPLFLSKRGAGVSFFKNPTTMIKNLHFTRSLTRSLALAALAVFNTTF
jgi:hypothetical protein